METKPKNGEPLLERFKEQRRIVEAISRIGPEGIAPDRLMHHVAAQVARITHIERTKVMRYRPDRGDLLVEAGVGWKSNVVGNATLAADYASPAGRSIQTGAPVLIHDIRSSDFYYPDLLRDHGVISVLNVPVMINGETWGVLEVDSSGLVNFDEWDVSFLTVAANVMGVCIALQDLNRKHIDAIAETARERARSEISMRELQHRIKNNLQIIVAFLLTKIRQEASNEVRERLLNVVGRVQAVALAHDLLSIGDNRSRVSFDEYLHSLCINVGAQKPDVTIELEADHVQIPIDRAVPVGLIVNELVTNSLKYAFGNRCGYIKVRFRFISNASEGCITVEDDGEGMEVPPPHKGLGLTLIEGFVQQIQGRIEYVPVASGSRALLCFPIAV